MHLILFLISFCTSIIGVICGIGGGIIIKPVLDAFGFFNPAEISFLSGCTVLAMSLFSVIGIAVKKGTRFNNISTCLAIGAAIGGIIGKNTFNLIWATFENKNMPGLIQTVCLLLLSLFTFCYTLRKEKIRTHKYNSLPLSALIGLLLGVMSSFLGIGGGPMNLLVLYYLFSMDTKTAAANSLYIILISQITSLASTAAMNKIPDVNITVLICMAVGGIAGGILGRVANKNFGGKTVDKLFKVLLIAIVAVNIFNIIKFSVA